MIELEERERERESVYVLSGKEVKNRKDVMVFLRS